MIRWLVGLLRTPSSFPADPWGYARNQIGHGYIVGGLPVLIWPPLILPLILAYLIWEDLQVTLYHGTLSDSLEDTANVATVALAAWMHQPLVLVIHLLFLAAGTRRRVEERNRAKEAASWHEAI